MPVFTGLVQSVGVVKEVLKPSGMTRFLVDPADLLTASAPAPAFQFGESISVSGACLTLAAAPGEHSGRLAFDAIPETLRRTSLGQLVVGSRVNLERSVTPATLLGGHVVQGHVDGLGIVTRIQQGDDWRIRVRPGPTPEAPGTDPMAFLVPKGSVCMDGVSLTIASLGREDGGTGAPQWFEVALIPTTLAKTTLVDLKVGDSVNLEFDIMAKTVVHYLRHFSR